MRILLVEDEPTLRAQLREALQAAAYAVDEADNGRDAHFLGDTETFDAVVLDRVLCRLRTLPCILIYNIPTHADRVHGHGFTLLNERHGSHQNQSTTIYANHPRPA